MIKNITFIYSVERSFVKSDIFIFEALGYNVSKIFSRPYKSGVYFLCNRFTEFIKSMMYIPRSKIVISWFNDYHSLIPILISKIFFKKSIIIIGGYDAIVDKENSHGVFYKKNIRSKIARLNYSLVSEVWVVHKSLIKGCDNAAKKFSIISGVETFIKNKNLKIKEINTGYDSRYWTFDETMKKSGILTVAFFSDKRVINIKGLDKFNKLASLLPSEQFLIVGEVGIDIAEHIKLEPNVKVLGVQNKDQIKSLYQKSKFYFQGSRLEGLPNSLCEAMLCGCLPIGSKVFGIPDAIGSTGILFDNEEDLKKVATYVNSTFGKKEFKNARKRIKEKFSLMSRIEKIKENI